MPCTCEGLIAPPTAPSGWFLLKADIDAPDEQLRPLRGAQDAPAPDPRLVARAVEEAVGLRPAGPEPVAVRGTFHWVIPVDLVDGRRVIARVSRIDHPALRAGLLVETAVAELLEREGIAAPRVLAVDTERRTLSGDLLVMERVEGAALASQEGDEAAMLSGLGALGGLLRRVHDVRLEGAGPLEVRRGGGLFGRFAQWDSFLTCRLGEHLRACVEAGALSAPESERLGERLATWTTAPGVPTNRLLHGDPGPSNVIRGADGGAYLVDWEDAQVGDPLFDLASAAAFHPERRWSALFDGYGWRPSATRDIERFWLYMARIALARTVMRRRFALPDLPGRTPAADRVRRALTGLEQGDRP